MGLVFAVTHLKLGKRFALKLLKKELAKDPETRARFLLEAQAAGQIHHPNVVEITDYTSLPDGSAYLVMEYLDGQPLAKMIKLGGAIPALRAVSRSSATSPTRCRPRTKRASSIATSSPTTCSSSR